MKRDKTRNPLHISLYKTCPYDFYSLDEKLLPRDPMHHVAMHVANHGHWFLFIKHASRCIHVWLHACHMVHEAIISRRAQKVRQSAKMQQDRNVLQTKRKKIWYQSYSMAIGRKEVNIQNIKIREPSFKNILKIILLSNLE